MIYIWTAFDKTGKVKPTMSAVFDSTTNKVDFYPLYGHGGKVNEVWERLTYIASLFDYPVVVNDFKAHVEGFSYLRSHLPDLLPLDRDYSVYVVPEEEDINIPQDSTALRKYLASKIVEAKRMGTAKWQLLLGDASLIYLTLQKRGVRHGGLEVYPKYEFGITGRSKTTGFSVQGQGDGEDIAHVDEDKDVFVCADWIAADIRAAALISEDPKLLESFTTSDPYTDMAKIVGKPRSEFKNTVVLPGLYSLNLNSEIFRHYPDFKKWATNAVESMDSQGYLTSMLGRKFYVSGKTNAEILNSRRQVFNAQMQATVAHAMQSALVKISQRLPRHILTELYDQVIISCTKADMKMVVGVIQEVMLHPLDGIVPSNPKFPLKVSVGTKWREWNKLNREIR